MKTQTTIILLLVALAIIATACSSQSSNQSTQTPQPGSQVGTQDNSSSVQSGSAATGTDTMIDNSTDVVVSGSSPDDLGSLDNVSVSDEAPQ